jgi:hypothetical protein
LTGITAPHRIGGIRPAGNMDMAIRCNKQMSGCITALAMAMICLVSRHVFAGSTNTPAPRPNPPVAMSSNSLPAIIITTDGKTYNGATLLKIQPDGLLVQYRPDAGGIGLATLKFAQLPQPLQRQFGYDPAKASAFEQAQAHATVELSQKLRREDGKDGAARLYYATRIDPDRFVKVTSSEPTVTYEYYVPGRKPDTLEGGISTCRHDYQCHADFDFHTQTNAGGRQVVFYVDAVRISLGLNCHIIEPQAPFDFIRNHEEGRRKIYEYFYRFSPQVAASIGKSMLGATGFSPPEKDFETAKAHANRDAEIMVKGMYHVRFDTVASQANKYFEKLTDYDENNANTDQAVQAAIAKYADGFPD